MTVIGEPVLDPVLGAGLAIAVNDETGFPPFAFAVNPTVAVVSPAEADPIVGACGTVVALIAFALTPEDDPFALTAFTVNVYEVAESKLVTVTGETGLEPDFDPDTAV